MQLTGFDNDITMRSESERNRPRLMMLATVPPWPPDIGGRQRTNLLYRALAQVADVDLACVYQRGGITPEQAEYCREHFRMQAVLEWDDITRHWSQRGVKTLSRWLHYPRTLDLVNDHVLRDRFRYRPDADAAQWLRRQLATTHYDAIVGRFLLPLVKADAFGPAPLLLDIDDVDFMHYRTRAAAPETTWHARQVYEWCARRSERIVRAKLRQCDHVWTASEDDLTLLGLKHASALPNIPYVPEGESTVTPCPANAASQVILTVGSLGYQPNREGIDWFLREAWPEIRRRTPRAEFWIAGKARQLEADRWQQIDGVVLKGYVSELRPLYEQAAFCIAPVFIGAGTKIKVLESLAYGRTCVVTPHAHYGYERELVDRESVVAAGSAREWIDACVRLLGDVAQRDRLAIEGQRQVALAYNFQKFAQVVARGVESVLKTRRGGAGNLREQQPCTSA